MKKTRKTAVRLLCTALTCCFTASAYVTAVPAEQYKAVWADEMIDYLKSKGVIDGYHDGTVQPDAYITRAEYAALLNKALGLQDTNASLFKDIRPDKWYADEFRKAHAAHYISGDINGNVRPDDYITRAEVCTMTARALRLDKFGRVSFVDSMSIPDWAIPYVCSMVTLGLIQGYPDTTFRPNKNITRAEAFSVISAMLANQKQPEQEQQESSTEETEPATEVVVSSAEEAGYIVHLDMVTDYRVSDDLLELTLTGFKGELQWIQIEPNDVVQLPATKDYPDGYMYRVSAVVPQNGTYVLIGEPVIAVETIVD